jgi:hypothetical protein
MRNRRLRFLRGLSICWAVVWGLAWGGLTIVSLNARYHTEPSDTLFRTGALVACWAGLFAWKALQPHDGPKDG